MDSATEQPEQKVPTSARIIELIAPFKTLIIALIVATMALSLMSMMLPLLTRTLINDVITNARHDLLKPVALGFLAITVSYTLVYRLQLRGIAYLGQRFVLDLRMRVYRHMMALHLGFFSKHSTGMLINRLMGDTTTMQSVLNVATIQIVSDLVSGIFAISATLYINWRLAIPVFGVVALTVANYKMRVRKLRQTIRTHRTSSDLLAAGVQNRLSANITVKTYGTELREDTIFAGESEVNNDASQNLWDTQIRFNNSMQFINQVSGVTIWFLGCFMVLQGSMPYGDVIAFTTYSSLILGPAVRFSEVAQNFLNVRIAAERLFEILDEVPAIRNPPHPRRITGVRGKVDIENVEFSYVPGTPVIRKLDLSVQPGETIALVGATGCGKSTILSLVMRLFDVSKGSIKIDGVDVRDFDLQSLRRNFGIVLQESMLFTISILDNIRYARPDATRAEVDQAARIAEIHNDIMRLPNGYDSVVGGIGVQLSIGQKQRLSIARAVLANPSIIIMDEATSSLDSESELAIQRAMERFLHGRTSFIVAHRLSTIRNASRILMLDKGYVVECGSHDELMRIEDGRYRKLYESHAGKGVLDDGE